MTTSIIEAKSMLSANAEIAKFELAQRKAKVYASSTLVPKEYQGNIANVMIAMEMAERLGVNDLMAMQNINIIHGRPSFSSQFLISCFNACGRFTAIKYRETADSCTAYATELATGEEVTGTTVTLEMAKAEGWVSKNGSKWKTMPQHMLRWRAASFLVRQVAPEVGMGFHTTEEVIDTHAVTRTKADVLARLDPMGYPLDPAEDKNRTSEPQEASTAAPAVEMTWEEAIAAETTAEGVYAILGEIDDSGLSDEAKRDLGKIGMERIEELKG